MKLSRKRKRTFALYCESDMDVKVYLGGAHRPCGELGLLGIPRRDAERAEKNVFPTKFIWGEIPE